MFGCWAVVWTDVCILSLFLSEGLSSCLINNVSIKLGNVMVGYLAVGLD